MEKLKKKEEVSLFGGVSFWRSWIVLFSEKLKLYHVTTSHCISVLLKVEVCPSDISNALIE